ncbi:MAG: hypothetical protein M3416_09935 [Acidobacteriota bacterium]|nr:hypothetical protein [Acidobacteriota bacterium]
MNKTYTLPEDDLRGELYRRIYLLISKKRGGWQSAGAAFGLAGGALSIPLALLLWAAVRFLAPAALSSTLNLLSNVFFALSVPLLALGACCLDLLEKKLPALPPPAGSRAARFERRHRLRPGRPRRN